jgi:putative redox protein
MIKVFANIGKEPYKIEIKSVTNNVLIADEPIDNGGKDLGFSPKELLSASLAACTSATVRTYADRKAWNLDEVKVEIEFTQPNDESIFTRKVAFVGDLTDDQKAMLLKVANACPIHKILTHPINIETSLL